MHCMKSFSCKKIYRVTMLVGHKVSETLFRFVPLSGQFCLGKMNLSRGCMANGRNSQYSRLTMSVPEFGGANQRCFSFSTSSPSSWGSSIRPSRSPSAASASAAASCVVVTRCCCCCCYQATVLMKGCLIQ